MTTDEEILSQPPDTKPHTLQRKKSIKSGRPYTETWIFMFLQDLYCKSYARQPSLSILCIVSYFIIDYIRNTKTQKPWRKQSHSPPGSLSVDRPRWWSLSMTRLTRNVSYFSTPSYKVRRWGAKQTGFSKAPFRPMQYMLLWWLRNAVVFSTSTLRNDPCNSDYLWTNRALQALGLNIIFACIPWLRTGSPQR